MSQIKNFGIYGISKILSSLISFLIVPVYSFFLSESDFGKIAIVSTTIALISIFINCSLTVDYTIKFFKRNVVERKKYRINIIYFSTIMCMLWTLLLFIFLEKIQLKLKLEIPTVYYFKIILIAFFSSITNFLLEDLKMLGKSKEFALFNLLIIILTSFFIIVGIKYFNLGLTGYIDAQFFALFIIFIVFILVEFIQKKVKFTKFCLIEIKNGLVFGFPIIFSFVFSYISNYADRYILQELIGYKVLGVYSMGYKFGEAFNGIIVSSYVLSINPILLKIYSNNLEEYKNKMKIFFEYFILVFIVYFLSLATGINFVFSFLKKEYLNARLITEIITISYFAFGLSQIISITILSKGKIKNISVFTILCGIINIVLNYILIPKYGSLGAASATLISYLLYLTLSLLYAQKLENIKLYDSRLLKFVILSIPYYFIIKYIYANNILIGLLLKSIILFLFLITVFILKLYPEINKIILETLKKIPRSIK